MGLYANIPKGLKENLAYRQGVLRRCATDKGFRRAMLAASKHDVLLWLNLFVWLYEPRPRFGSDGRLLPKVIPCITWPHQDPVILEIDKNLGLNDIGVEKARGEGMSWLALMLALRDWLFEDGAKVGLVSNTEKKADDPGNMDSLLAKIDWELTKLPKWMAGIKEKDYRRNLSDHSLVNLRNMAQINAFAATGDAGRAGRYKWFLADELAFWDRGIDSQFMTSIRGSTECRLVVSTPNGSDGEYYDFMHIPSASTVRLVLDWKDNPTRNRGLYEYKDGKAIAIDPVNNPLPANYDPPDQGVLDLWSGLIRKGFKLEKKIRSPWYDKECDRGATPQSIAQELDRDYGGSTYKVFGIEFMDEAKKGIRPPQKFGDLTYHPETLVPLFQTSENGPLHIWCSLDHRGRPPAKQYVVGADVSTGLAGSYTSNSAVSVIELSSMEQVAEFASNSMPPADFADFCMALSKWFYDAYLIWEANGPGSAFGKRVIDKQYGNVYYRTSHWKRGKGRKTREVGWWTDPRSKESMFEEIKRSVLAGEVRPRSKVLVEECGQYVRINGKIEHVLAVNTSDDSSKGQAHGDRVIGFGVALQGARDRPLASSKLEETLKENPPSFTMAARQKAYEDSLKAKDGDGWDDRTNDDLAGGEVFRRIAA